MRKIILNLAVTLDGFIEGPNGEIDWCRMDSDPETESAISNHFDDFLSRIDTIFYGRVSYDLWGNYQPNENASLAEEKLWNGVHAKKKYVFSRSSKQNQNNVAYISDNFVERVKEIKYDNGKDIWLYGGGDLITSFMNAGLIDNYLIAIYPVILGKGKPLFQNIQQRIGLKLRSVTTSGAGVMLVDYESAQE